MDPPWLHGHCSYVDLSPIFSYHSSDSIHYRCSPGPQMTTGQLRFRLVRVSVVSHILRTLQVQLWQTYSKQAQITRNISINQHTPVLPLHLIPFHLPILSWVLSPRKVSRALIKPIPQISVLAEYSFFLGKKHPRVEQYSVGNGTNSTHLYGACGPEEPEAWLRNDHRK